MIQTSIRRIALPLTLATLALTTSGTSFAQTVTGTDPCPKNMVCSAGNATKTASTNSATQTSTSSSSTVVQAILVFLGVA